MTEATTTEPAPPAVPTAPTQQDLAGLFKQFNGPAAADPAPDPAPEAAPESAEPAPEPPVAEPPTPETEGETAVDPAAVAEPASESETDPAPEGEGEAAPEVALQFEAPPAPVIAPPVGMTPVEAQAFQALTPDMQRYVASRELARNTDLERRTNDLADQRAQAEALRNQYSERLQHRIAALEAETAQPIEPPSPELREQDYEAYEQQRDAYILDLHKRQQRQTELDTLRREKDAEQQRQQVAAQAAREQHLAAQWAELPTRIPQAANPEKFAPIQQDIQRYALEKGYTPDELTNVRAVDMQMLYQSMLYERAVASAGKAKPKPRPQAPKSQQPGTSQPIAKVTDKRFQAAKQAFDKAPDKTTLAGMFRSMRPG